MPAVGRGVAAVGVVLLVTLWAPGARGQSTAGEKDAQGLFKKAEIQFSLGNYQLALDLYKMAHDLSPRPSYLFNIGQCHHRLGAYDKAVRTFELYLFQEPETDDRRDVEILIDKSRKAKRDAALARTHLRKKPALPQARPPTDAPTAAPGAMHRALLWTGVGLTVALVAAGTVTGQLASDDSDRYNDPATPSGNLQGLRDSGETLRTASIATFAAGGAVALGAALYYLMGYRRAGATVALSPTVGGIALSGAF